MKPPESSRADSETLRLGHTDSKAIFEIDFIVCQCSFPADNKLSLTKSLHLALAKTYSSQDLKDLAAKIKGRDAYEVFSWTVYDSILLFAAS